MSLMKTGQARIIFFGYLIDLVKEREVVLEITEPTKVKDVLSRSLSVSQGLDVVVLINDYPATIDSYVKPGDTVKILPHIGGG